MYVLLPTWENQYRHFAMYICNQLMLAWTPTASNFHILLVLTIHLQLGGERRIHWASTFEDRPAGRILLIQWTRMLLISPESGSSSGIVILTQLDCCKCESIIVLEKKWHDHIDDVRFYDFNICLFWYCIFVPWHVFYRMPPYYVNSEKSRKAKRYSKTATRVIVSKSVGCKKEK